MREAQCTRFFLAAFGSAAAIKSEEALAERENARLGYGAEDTVLEMDGSTKGSRKVSISRVLKCRA